MPARKKPQKVDGDFAVSISNDILADAVASVERRLQRRVPPPVATDEAATTLVDEILVDVDLRPPAAVPEAMGEEIVIDLEGFPDQPSDDDVQALAHAPEALTEAQPGSSAADAACAAPERNGDSAGPELEAVRQELEQANLAGRLLKRRLKAARKEVEALERRLQDAERERRETWEQNRTLEQVVRGLKRRLEHIDEEMERQHRRAVREIEHARQFGHENTVREFIPVADDLERALEHADGDSALLHEGVVLVSRHFRRVLQRLGVELIEAEPGMAFAPEFHEALMRVPKADVTAETIERVIRPGYLLQGRLFRAAQVTVAIPDPPPPTVVDDAAVFPLPDLDDDTTDERRVLAEE